MNDRVVNWNKTRTNSFFGHHVRSSAYIQNRKRIFITFFNISSFTAYIQRFWNANNEYCCLRENIYLSEVSTLSYLAFTAISMIPAALSPIPAVYSPSTEFPFQDETYILDIFARRMAHQSLRSEYLNLSTFPLISMAFQTNQKLN